MSTTEFLNDRASRQVAVEERKEKLRKEFKAAAGSGEETEEPTLRVKPTTVRLRPPSRTLREFEQKVKDGYELTTKDCLELQKAVETRHGDDRTFAIGQQGDIRYFYFPGKEDAGIEGDCQRRRS